MVVRGLFLGVLSLISTAYAQEACSGHGRLVDDKCVCSSPLPLDTEPGWVGDQCSVQVHRLFLTGQSVQDTCGQGKVCNMVTPNNPVCFSTSIEEMANTSYHLALLLGSNDVDVAVTLRGLLTNFTTTTDPSSGTTTVAPQAYPTSASVFSFTLHTSHDAASAQLQLSRRQLGYGAYTGLYVCAESAADTTIDLRGATHTCPFAIQPDGNLKLCSGRGTSEQCPHGTCACTAPYAPPANWLVAPGLGFEDCSATLQPLQLGAAPQTPAALAPGSWAFFSLDWPAKDVYELQVAAVATQATKGQLLLYLRQSQLPGPAQADHDLANDVSQSAWARDLSAHITMTRSHPAFRPGTWYLGVANRGSEPVTYNLSAVFNGCPNDCSGRGVCAPDTATCTCNQPTYLPPDCAVAAYELTLGQTHTTDPWVFAADTLVLRDARQQLQAAGASELLLSASFTVQDTDPAGLPAWVPGRPTVIVSPNAAAIANATAGDEGGLWAAGELARLVLAAAGQQYSLELGEWMLAEDGSLHVLVRNPLTGPSRAVGYNLTVAVKASCPGMCSGHGSCDQATGKCTCQAPFIGSDCSVDSSQLACGPGSRHPVHRDDLRATCWAPCKDDGSGFDEGRCEELTCDGPGGGHGPLRRKGSELACVEDTCLAGEHSVVDSAGGYVCSRRCSCPEDGGPCSLESDCLPGTVKCLDGLQPQPGTNKCVRAVCQEGSLRRSYDLPGGAAFAVCTCAAGGDPATCAFTSPSPAAGNQDGVVSCLPGFERQGSTGSLPLSDGTSLTTGGSCGRPNKRRGGVSGGMVFFYCLLSIFLAAGLVVGGKYGMLWYEQYRYGRSVFGGGQVSWPLLGSWGQGGGAADDW